MTKSNIIFYHIRSYQHCGNIEVISIGTKHTTQM